MWLIQLILVPVHCPDNYIPAWSRSAPLRTVDPLPPSAGIRGPPCLLAPGPASPDRQHDSPYLPARIPVSTDQWSGGGRGGVSDPDPRTLLTTRLIWDSAMAPGWAVQEELSSKRETLTQCCLNVGLASQTVDQHWDNIVSTSRVLVGYLSFTLNHWILNHLPSVDYNLNLSLKIY